MTWKPEIDKLKEVLDFQYGHILDVGDNALVMQAASLWLDEQIPVQEADSLTVKAEVQGENVGRTGGANPPTGAIAEALDAVLRLWQEAAYTGSAADMNLVRSVLRSSLPMSDVLPLIEALKLRRMLEAAAYDLLDPSRKERKDSFNAIIEYITKFDKSTDTKEKA